MESPRIGIHSAKPVNEGWQKARQADVNFTHALLRLREQFPNKITPQFIAEIISDLPTVNKPQ